MTTANKMPGRKILRRFSSSISDLLSLQKREMISETECSTPLHTAVQMGNSVMVSNLVDSKTIWIDEEDGKGRTALHYAMEQGEPEIAAQLLKGGANVDCVDYDGISASHIACREGLVDNFNMLVYYHADICAIDKSGRTPFDLACETGQERMLDRIINSGVDVETLKKAGTTHTSSALHLAARNGHTHIVLRLLQLGWDINRVTLVGTVLHEAAGNGRAQVVRFLIYAGVDTSLTNSAGLTALEFAKKNATRNPITFKEIRNLLKGCKDFLYAVALKEYKGIKADELSFSVDDQIWVVERPSEGRWKGIVFGQKGNSRSGWFRADAVKTSERPTHMASMSSRLSMPAQMPQAPPGRQAKKVCLPTIPANAHYMQNKTGGDANLNPRMGMPMSYRAPSGLSDASSDSQNGNRRMNSLMTQSTFSAYGTDLAALLGVKTYSMATFPSTSTLPLTTATTSSAESHRISTGSNSSNGSSGFESMKCSASASSSSSSFHQSALHTGTASDTTPSRTSVHSSGSGSGSSSLASTSAHTLDDSFHSSTPASVVNVTAMVANGVPEAEILANWLDCLNMSEYLTMFLKQGYDLSSIARITPEDLLSLGIKNPDHRKRLMNEIHCWQITDSWPAVIPPSGLREWLAAIALSEYVSVFESQGYHSVHDVLNLTWEDLEDVGVKRLGHLKRLGLAVKKIKDHRRLHAMSVANLECVTSMPSQGVVQVPSPLLPARAVERPIQSPRLNDPPPPAPSSHFHHKVDLHDKIDYISYSRGAKAVPVPPIRHPVQLDKRRSIRSSYDSIFKEDEPIRLNLVSAGKILSDMSKERDCDFSCFDSSDCPPPPAPLYCEANSMRLLQGSLRSSICSNESATSIDQMPFANENCGTIKARETVRAPEPESIAPGIRVGSEQASALADKASVQRQTSNGNVLTDIGFMLQNLTDELDAMLLPKHNSSQVPNSAK